MFVMTRRAFSIIELVVIIGIIMILIGLLLPVASDARNQGLSTISLSNANQLSTMIATYTTEYDDVFPVADDRFWFEVRAPGEPWSDELATGRSWQWALIDAGFISAEQVVDPAHLNAINFDLSMTLSYPAQLMMPEALEHPADRVTAPVRVDQVVFPASKGSLSEILVEDDPAPLFWCCTYLDPPGAVTFLDGSAEAVAWHQLLDPEQAPLFGIGIPVRSTWKGVRGRDR
ncbi:MAG: hypothetical protein AAGJ83_15795 [Planctomycetota bacterium]